MSIGDCAKTLGIVIADGDAITSFKQIQFFAIPFDSARRSWTGTHQVVAVLWSRDSNNGKTTTTMLNSTVEILAADDPYAVDGGTPDTSNPPLGALDLRFTVQAPSATFAGTLSVHYCNWGLCI